MIKAILSVGSKKRLIVGLSAANLARMKEGKPARVALDDVKLEDLAGVADIAIMYGETEAAIVEELRKHADLPPAKVDESLA